MTRRPAREKEQIGALDVFTTADNRHHHRQGSHGSRDHADVRAKPTHASTVIDAPPRRGSPPPQKRPSRSRSTAWTPPKNRFRSRNRASGWPAASSGAVSIP